MIYGLEQTKENQEKSVSMLKAAKLVPVYQDHKMFEPTAIGEVLQRRNPFKYHLYAMDAGNQSHVIVTVDD